MQQTAIAPSSHGSASFAGIMAALAAPAQKPARNNDGINDGLDDDAATLSYERALRTHSRYKAPEPSDLAFTKSDEAFTQSLDPDVLRFCEAIPDDGDSDIRTAAPQAVSASLVDPEPDAAPDLYTAHDRNLKNASITIRLSKAECAQLRRRAAEAGLTVSAYLRSCTFEAESLRALVKDTLAQLRTDPLPPTPSIPSVSIAAQRNWRHWLMRFWPHPHATQSVVQA